MDLIVKRNKEILINFYQVPLHCNQRIACNSNQVLSLDYSKSLIYLECVLHIEQIYSLYKHILLVICGSPGDVSEEPVT